LGEAPGDELSHEGDRARFAGFRSSTEGEALEFG